MLPTPGVIADREDSGEGRRDRANCDPFTELDPRAAAGRDWGPGRPGAEGGLRR